MAWLAGAYPWIVAAHVIFVIFWMAGLFMLPRYLVYHQEALVAGRTEEATLWIDREAKIRSIILTPATVGQHWGEGWLHAKLLFVVLLSGYHGWAVGYAKRLATGVMRLDARKLRMINEVPALVATVVVVLVFVKPF